MGAPRSEETRWAYEVLRDFHNGQRRELAKLDWPTASSHAKDMGRGAIGLPPPTGEEDPIRQCAGRFWSTCKPVEQWALELSFRNGVPKRDRRKFHRLVDRVLVRFDGWLRGAGFG